MALIVAWYVPDWHDDGSGETAWVDLPTPETEAEFEEHVSHCDDDHADEGTFAKGLVRLDDGRVLPFEVEKAYSVDYSLTIEDPEEA